MKSLLALARWGTDDNLKLLKILHRVKSIEKVYYFEKLDQLVVHEGSYFPPNIGDTFRSKLGNVIYLGEL